MFSSSRIPVVALGGSLAAVTIFAAALSEPEARIDQSFAQAFDNHKPKLVAAAHDRDIAQLDPSMLHFSSYPGSPTPAPALGDRISFSGADGTVRGYRVIDVRPLSQAGGGLVLVTADGTQADGSSSPANIVRFIIETTATPSAPTAKPHAL